MGDLLGRFTLTDDDFADLTRMLMEIAGRHCGEPGRLAAGGRLQFERVGFGGCGARAGADGGERVRDAYTPKRVIRECTARQGTQLGDAGVQGALGQADVDFRSRRGLGGIFDDAGLVGDDGVAALQDF